MAKALILSSLVTGLYHSNGWLDASIASSFTFSFPSVPLVRILSASTDSVTTQVSVCPSVQDVVKLISTLSVAVIGTCDTASRSSTLVSISSIAHWVSVAANQLTVLS